METSGEILIRPASADDTECISRLETALSREFITPDYSPEGAATLLSNQSPEAIQKMIAEGTLSFVAEAEQGVVGVVAIMPERRHLYHLFVDRHFHRRGIGRRLWEAALDALGPGPVTVNSSRIAIGFYERLGFASAGPPWEKDGVIAYPMRWEPTILKST